MLWAGWNGGYVGGWIGDGFEALIGGAAFALPVVLVVVGGLMVGRSDLVEVRPFRTGTRSCFGLGLLLTLGSEGGYLGTRSATRSALALGAPESRSSASLGIVAGILLLSGASAGALIRRGATRGAPLARPPAARSRPTSRPS